MMSLRRALSEARGRLRPEGGFCGVLAAVEVFSEWLHGHSGGAQIHVHAAGAGGCSLCSGEGVTHQTLDSVRFVIQGVSVPCPICGAGEPRAYLFRPRGRNKGLAPKGQASSPLTDGLEIEPILLRAGYVPFPRPGGFGEQRYLKRGWPDVSLHSGRIWG